MDVRRNRYSWFFTLLLMVMSVFLLPPAVHAELHMASVYPTLGILGSDLTVTLQGTDFDINTRVSMYLDAGHKKSIIGSLPTQGEAWDVKVVGDKAFVAGQSGLHIIDMVYPDIPRLIGFLETGDHINRIAVSGDMVFAASTSGLRIIDVSTPSEPQQIGFVPTYDEAWGVAAVGHRVYVSEHSTGLLVVDVSTPSAPIVIGSLYLEYYSYDLAISGDLAYVTQGWGGMQIVDISDPVSPFPLGAISMNRFAVDVAVSGDTVFLVSSGLIEYESYLDIIDSGNPYLPQPIASIATPGIATNIVLADCLAYLTDGGSGVQIIDVGNPAMPEIKGTVDTPGSACGIDMLNHLVLVADTNAGLQIVDITESSVHTVIGALDTQDEASGIVVVGDTAFMTDGKNGLLVIDVSNPAGPVIIVSVDTPGDAARIRVQDSLAYMTTMDGGLQIVDVSDPQAPNVIGAYDTPGRSYGFALNNNIAYVADMEGGLQIINVETPSEPWRMGYLDSIGYAIHVAVSGDTAYVACGNDGLKVVDISDPTHPQLVSTISTLIPFGVEVVEEIAYISDASGTADSLRIFNIANPAGPVALASLNVPGAVGMRVDGDRVYMLDAAGSIQVVDVSDPLHPVWIGSVDTSGYANDLAIQEDKAFVANGKHGLSIVPVPVEVKPIDLSATRTITLPTPLLSGHYTLRVFDFDSSHELPGAVTFIPTEQSALMSMKAVIVAGSKADDKIQSEIRRNANKAYDALIYQGFTHESIYYLSSETGSDRVDADATYADLAHAINTWALEAPSPAELMLYFVDHGKDGTFGINAVENLTAQELDTWLDALQSLIPVKVVFVYDACQSGTFLAHLKPPSGRKRIVLTSTGDEPANYLGNGTITFSYQFWNVINETGVLDEAFFVARDLMRLFNQTAILDANGNGIGNEHDDFIEADGIVIRRGYQSASNTPKILETTSDQTLQGVTSAGLKATVYYPDLEQINRVWAIINPPDFHPGSADNPITDLPTVELLDPDHDGIFEATYTGFTAEGTYTVTVNAETIGGAQALSRLTTVTQTSGNPSPPPDDYETDDASVQAGVVVINATDAQRHTFHAPGDGDWMKFFGVAGQSYKIRASGLGAICDVVIELFDASDTGSPLVSKNDGVAGEDEYLDWICQQNGIYYVNVRNWNPQRFGSNAAYGLEVYRPVGPVAAWFSGTITDAISGKPIGNAVLNTTAMTSAISQPQSGTYELLQDSGMAILNVTADGYESFAETISITNEIAVLKHVTLFPLYDLSDAIVLLQVIAGNLPPSTAIPTVDVDGNGKAELKEIIAILQIISGER